MAFTRTGTVNHDSLAGVSAADHHTATVAADLDLADMNARAHADLSDAPADAHHAQSHDAASHSDISFGTWTPDLQFGDAKVNITYSVQRGGFMKAGTFIYVWGNIVLSSKGSSTGIACIHALPEAAAASKDGAFTIGNNQNVGFANELRMDIAAGGNQLVLNETLEAGSQASTLDSDFADNSALRFSGFYEF